MLRHPHARFVWYRLIKPRLLLDPVALARDLTVAVLVALTRPRRRP